MDPQPAKAKELNIVQQRAISMLSMGETPMNVAIALDISRQSLFRWRQEPDFKAALDRAVAELNLNARAQVEATARIALEGGLDAVTQLRNIVLRVDTSDHDRRLSCMNLVRVTERFWDLMGYNAKLPNKQTLLCDQIDKLNDAVHVGDPPIPRPHPPGDRHLRPETEVDPPEGGCGALARPQIFYAWRDNPVNEDGTPKNPPEPQAHAPGTSVQKRKPKPKPKMRRQPAPEVAAAADLDVDVKPEVAANKPEIEPAARRLQLAAANIKAPSRKPRPKAWKRSATTLRCKPGASPLIARGTKRHAAATPAARRAKKSHSAELSAAPTPDAHGPG